MNIDFPKRSFGKKKPVHGSFQSAWFERWKWIYYDSSVDRAYCFPCMKALKEQKLSSNMKDQAFIETGFYNWKDSTSKKCGFH